MDKMLLVTVTLNGQVNGQDVFSKDKIVLGRDPECDIVLDNPGISRQHAEISVKGENFVLNDLGSANGVLVNQHPVGHAPLTDGDVLQIGKYVLYVRIVEDPRGAKVRGSSVNPWQRDETIRAKQS